MLSLVRLFSAFLIVLTASSTFADTGLFRLQGKIYFTSDIVASKKAFSNFQKCHKKPIYLEIFLGDKISNIIGKESGSIEKLISYEKLHHHAVINSSPEMGIAAQSKYNKCFNTMTDDTYGFSISEYYLREVVRTKSKVSEMLSELDKLYPHELLRKTSTSTLWKKK